MNDKADEKLIEIENDTNATFEEREEAKTSVNEALTNAKNAVRNATTNQLVETVLTLIVTTLVKFQRMRLLEIKQDRN